MPTKNILQLVLAIDDTSLAHSCDLVLPSSETLYFAITSTYPLPFFPFLTVPPFLACGIPIKSSMLLAPLIPVAGLDGGAEGGPDGGPVAERAGAAFGSIDVSRVVVGAFTIGDELRDGF